jgi:transposase-like protein
MSGTKGTTHYSTEKKAQAIQLHETEGLTYEQVAKQLGIRKAKQILVWVQRYRQVGAAWLCKPGSGRPRQAHTEQERVAQLEMENALLKKYHTELRKTMLARRNIGSSNTTAKTTR